MYKTSDRTIENVGNVLAVSAETLAGMLDCGRATAVKIGMDAGARIQVGRRTLYIISKVEKHLKTLSA